MLLLRAPLHPPEITEEIRRRFSIRDEADGLEPVSEITAVVTNGGIGLPGDLMAKLPALRMIAVFGVGVDQIDLEQAKRRDIAITTTPHVLTDAVAEHAIALILAAGRRIVESDRFVRAGHWEHGKFGLGKGLGGQSLGILGYGRIGRRIGELARSLGMTVLYCDLRPDPTDTGSFRPTPEDLARDADLLVIAAAGGAGTTGLVGADVLAALGPEGLLVNVARGSVVDEDALVEALRSGRLGQAALDVFADEPRPHTKLLEFDNVVLTPHVASGTLDARLAMGRLVIDNLVAFVEGRDLVTPLPLDS